MTSAEVAAIEAGRRESTLLKLLATHFQKEMGDGFEDLRLKEDLGADDYDAEEIRLYYEDAMGVLVVEDFESAETVGDLLEIIERSRTLPMN